LSLVDLGRSPLANSYVLAGKEGTADPTYPLHVRVCEECWLAQVSDDIPAAEIFSDDYAYFSSFSDSWLTHCKAYVRDMTRRLDLSPNSLVTEIASNDGYLLQYFLEMGIPVLGIEPAGNVARTAERKGVPTVVEFFDDNLAHRLVAEGRRPDLIASANVLAHVPDINDFVAGIATLLSGDAVYTVEFPHLLNLIQRVQFDTIYHEHYSYLSLLALETIFAKAGLRVFDVEEFPTHGGSLRVFVCLTDAQRSEGQGVAAVRKAEKVARLDHAEGYTNFAGKVETLRDGLLSFLETAKRDGKRVAAYGAAAKGNTLLNYAAIDTDLIAYCVDRNPAKQNTLLPGSRIPVRTVDALRADPPDYVLILPWNIRNEVIGQLSDLKSRGTRFVTAVPEIRVE
jgi:hypothetical protein